MPTEERCEDCKFAQPSDMPNWAHCWWGKPYVYLSLPLQKCKFEPSKFEPKAVPK